MTRKFLGLGPSVDFGGQRAANAADATSATDLVTKQQLDAAVNGHDWKDAVRVASTATINLATGLAAGQTVDGVTLATGDRVLVKDQSTASQNGIYVAPASGAASRATDADASAEVTSGLAVIVTSGTVNGDTAWVLTTADPIVLATTSLTFVKLPGLAQAYATVDAAGTPLTQRSVLNFGAGFTASDNGGASRTDVVIDTAVVVRKFAQDIGDNSTTSFGLTHGLATLDVTVEVYDKSTGAKVEPDVVHTSSSVCTLVFQTAPTTNQYRAVVHG